MTLNDLLAEDVNVSKKEKIETIRQVIQIPEQLAVPRILEAMWAVLRRGRFTVPSRST